MAKVKFSRNAELDVETIDEYYLNVGVQVADAFISSVEKVKEQLRENPFSAQISSEKPLAKRGYRKKILIYKYCLFYKIEGEIVYVVRILHGKQNHARILKKESLSPS